MTAALVFRGGELLTNEAAISAILLASIEPTASGFSADRILEGLIGGGVGLAVASLLLPPDPPRWSARSRRRCSASSGERSRRPPRR